MPNPPLQPTNSYVPTNLGTNPWERPTPVGPFDGASDPRDMSRPLYGCGFGHAIRRFVVGSVRFSGRASASEYWLARLFVVAVSVVLVCLGLLTYELRAGYVTSIAWDAVLLFNLVALLPTAAITGRRRHDANRPGPLALLAIIPIGALAVLILVLMPSKPEGRRYDRARRLPSQL
jgi:uncharacterized membrane protein YhaH (DUF805 family)